MKSDAPDEERMEAIDYWDYVAFLKADSTRSFFEIYELLNGLELKNRP